MEMLRGLLLAVLSRRTKTRDEGLAGEISRGSMLSEMLFTAGVRSWRWS